MDMRYIRLTCKWFCRVAWAFTLYGFIVLIIRLLNQPYYVIQLPIGS